MKRLANSLLKWLWENTQNYSLELHAAITAAWLGLWIMLFTPLSSGSPTVRGLYLLNEVVAFLPWKSDYTWGIGFLIPSVIQIQRIITGDRIYSRAMASFVLAMLFSFWAACIAIVNWRSTGVAMYFMLTVANCIIFARLTQQRFSILVA